MQLVPQLVTHLQLPLTHCWVAVQALPQAPQFWELLARSTHEPLQSCRPDGQVEAQLPLAQT
jgi:hypothetical protein